MLSSSLIYIILNRNEFISGSSLIKSFENRLLKRSLSSINETKTNKEIIDLPSFIPFTSFRTYHIDELTSPLTINELIQEAKETNKFTIFCDQDHSIQGSIQIQLIQSTQSYMISIKSSLDFSTLLCHHIHQLFVVIFDHHHHTNRIINIWGNMDDILRILNSYDMFSYNMNYLIDIIDVQQRFKQWYNKTFDHNIDCKQILDYHNIDGPLCSCSHRPLKTLNEQWRLEYAIAYTFSQNLNVKNDDIDANIHKCLAITSLASVIEQQWTRKQIKGYIWKCRRQHVFMKL
ncbi:unnamed protein product [Adineta ricciae]|uniref:Uncharacterized protein n=1 Tax=Adineta ricciae TaxID=249248 RepID=A0A815SZQ6_ADIRI|nr:unnamed protein product [Adineta ricciae]CAF1498604.1 unnamed protein product [Adineta ricciae]